MSFLTLEVVVNRKGSRLVKMVEEKMFVGPLVNYMGKR